MLDNIKKLLGATTKSSSIGDIFSSFNVAVFGKRFDRKWSQADFLSAYEVSLYTNRALNKRAEKVAEIEFTLMKGDKPIENDKTLDMLYKPNKAMSGYEFWKLYQKYYDIFGEVYLLLDGEKASSRLDKKNKINGIHILFSPNVKPTFNEQTGRLSIVEYTTGKGTTVYSGDEVLYIRNPNPRSPLRGESLIASGMLQIDTLSQIEEYHANVIENGGNVDGVFNFDTDRQLTKQQLQEIKDKYQEEYASSKKTNTPLFLSGKAKYERLGMSPAEMSYTDTKKLTIDDISMLTGVPKAILAVTSGETFSNADASIRIFLRETIKPLLTSLTSALDNELFPDDTTLSFVDPTPEDREETRKDVESGIKNYYMTPNEAREVMGFEPIKGGDALLAPMNVIPLSTPKPEVKIIEKEVERKITHPLQDKNTRRIYHALQMKRLDTRQKRMLTVMQEYFDGQKDRLLDQLSPEKNYKFRKKDILDETFNKTLEVNIAKETVLPLLEELLVEAGELSKEISGSDFTFTATTDIQSWLNNKTEVFAQQINDTTFKQLQRQFAESLDNGETRPQLVKRIKDTYGDISKGRAEVIARTEVHGVTQYGTLEGYKQAGVPIKIWTWSPGTQGGIRDSHAALDGKKEPTGTEFSNGLMFPGDPSGGAAETANCQCFI